MIIMNKQALSAVIVVVIILTVSGAGCTTITTKSNNDQSSVIQNTTLVSNVSKAIDAKVYPPDSSNAYAYGNVYFNDYYGTHDKVVEMFALSQYPTCHLCKYKSAEITLYQSSNSPDVWIAPYLIYYSKMDTSPYYERVGQDVAAYSLLGDKPIISDDLGWVHMTRGDVKYVYTRNFVPNNAHWIVYGALIYFNGHIQQLYPDMHYVIWY